VTREGGDRVPSRGPRWSRWIRVASSVVRVAAVTLAVTTLPFVTECSAADAHVTAEVGVGMPWARVEHGPQERSRASRWTVDLREPAVPTATFLAVLAGMMAATLEVTDTLRRPMIAVGALWLSGWIAFLLPFPFLFFGFLGHPAVVAAAATLGFAAELVHRSRGPRELGPSAEARPKPK
jgi:hypothetical protein